MFSPGFTLINTADETNHVKVRFATGSVIKVPIDGESISITNLRLRLIKYIDDPSAIFDSCNLNVFLLEYQSKFYDADSEMMVHNKDSVCFCRADRVGRPTRLVGVGPSC